MSLLVNVEDGNWSKVRRNFQRLGSNLLGPGAVPPFANVQLSDLTASEFVMTDADKGLVSLAVPILVNKGGTGLVTITNHGLMLGSGTDAVTVLAEATDGQLPIGSTGNDPVLATLTGSTDRVSVTNAAGSITLDLAANTQTLLDSFNGIFLETIDFTVSEAGGTVTGSLEKDGTGDLIQRFSDGYSTLDCSPALTINLTAYVGTDAVPAKVFVYILQSAKTVMAASNADWPVTEHIKVANLLLRSAATTGTDGGALVNRNWNDHAQSADSQGHITHIEERLRQEPTQWESGVSLALKDSAGNALTTGNSSTAVELVTAIGVAYQMHRHTFAAVDMYTTATDLAHVVNQPTDEGGAYKTTSDLVSDITYYVDGTAAGVAIGVNKYFNLVVWGVMNRTGERSHLMINLPVGQYTTEAAATADDSGYSVFDIPAAFKGVGFLIARLTFRLIAGAEWTYIAQEDLRGQIPPATAGVSVSTTAHDLLSNLDFASAGHTGFQAQSDALDSIVALGAIADNEFIVGTGAGTYAHESGATVRTSLGLGTGDSPTFTNLTLTGGTINFAEGDYLQFHIASNYYFLAIGGVVCVRFDSSAPGGGVRTDYITEYAPDHGVIIEGVKLIDNHIRILNGEEVRFYDVGSSHYVGFEAPALTATKIWVLPNVDGGAGELLRTDGAGNLSWIAAGADAFTVKVDAAAAADYIGVASSDGVLRTGAGLSYTDGGNFVTLDLDINTLTAETAILTETDYYAVYDATAALERKVLVPLVAERTSRIINLDNSMSQAEIQAAIDAVGKMVLPGVDITFQFADGTYTITAPIDIGGYIGGGRILIQGNMAEADSAHTNQAVILDGSSLDDNVVWTHDCVCQVFFYKVAVAFKSSTSINNRGIYGFDNTYTAVLYSYLYGNSVNYGMAFNASAGAAILVGTYVSNCSWGIVSAYCLLVSIGNPSTGTNPKWGLWARYAARIGKSSTQPTGSTANELVSEGGEIT